MRTSVHTVYLINCIIQESNKNVKLRSNLYIHVQSFDEYQCIFCEITPSSKSVNHAIYLFGLHDCNTQKFKDTLTADICKIMLDFLYSL